MRSPSPNRSRLSLPLMVALLLSAGGVRAQVIVPNLVYTSVVPCRILDTRLATAGRLAANTVRTFNIVGGTTGVYTPDFASQGGASNGCAVPGFWVTGGGGEAPPLATPSAITVSLEAQVQAVVINLAVVNASGPGFLNAWPSDHPMPFSSLINYTIGTTVANQVVLAVRQDAPGADISVLAAVSGTHLIGDVVGYFTANSSQNSVYRGFGAGNQSVSTGARDLAVGDHALAAVTNGSDNVALGSAALAGVTTAQQNVAVGSAAMNFLTTGQGNIAIGYGAGDALTGNEQNDIYIGHNGVVGEVNTIRIGTEFTQFSAYMAGIYNSGVIDGTPVYVNNNGQLGSIPSSLRFKEDVADMGDASKELMQLRPVIFHFKPEIDGGAHVLQYGLVAEEVAKVDPDLVQADPDGRPHAVRSHLINAMMLNEVQRQHHTIKAQQVRIDEQQARIDEQQAQIAKLQRQVRAVLQQRQPGGSE